MRFRYLGACGGRPRRPDGFTEITVRAEELAAAPRGIRRGYVVENEITYLAFPPPPDAIVIFGGGYAVSVLGITRLAGRPRARLLGRHRHPRLLDPGRLRRRFPQARSMLMDRATLLAHRDQWVTEPAPVCTELECLTPQEATLYRDLATGRLGPSIRLEQERVRFSLLEAALRPGTPGSHRPVDGGRAANLGSVRKLSRTARVWSHHP